jgi:L-rhamnose isomerase
MKAMQNNGDFTGLLTLTEELKSYPWCDVWDAFCEMNNTPERDGWLETVRAYDAETRKRG